MTQLVAGELLGAMPDAALQDLSKAVRGEISQRCLFVEQPDEAITIAGMEAEDYENVDIIASGYEFYCPACETYNTLIAIPRYGTAVECHNCHERFFVFEANDAQE